MKKKFILTSLGIAILTILIFLITLPKQAEGKIKSCHVVEGVGYTLTVVLDSGSEVKADFSGGQLSLGARCEIRRTYFLSKWFFVRYVTETPASDLTNISFTAGEASSVLFEDSSGTFKDHEVKASQISLENIATNALWFVRFPDGRTMPIPVATEYKNKITLSVTDSTGQPTNVKMCVYAQDAKGIRQVTWSGELGILKDKSSVTNVTQIDLRFKDGYFVDGEMYGGKRIKYLGRVIRSKIEQ